MRGPQLALAGIDPKRTPRLRYLESPTKRTGRPFFALRVPGDVLNAFKRKAKPNPAAAVRAFMSKVAGVKLAVDEGDHG